MRAVERRWIQAEKTLGRLRCRWFNRHSDEIYTVGHNVGTECRFCGRHGILTPKEIAFYLGVSVEVGGEDEVVAVAPPPD